MPDLPDDLVVTEHQHGVFLVTLGGPQAVTLSQLVQASGAQEDDCARILAEGIADYLTPMEIHGGEEATGNGTGELRQGPA